MVLRHRSWAQDLFKILSPRCVRATTGKDRDDTVCSQSVYYKNEDSEHGFIIIIKCALRGDDTHSVKVWHLREKLRIFGTYEEVPQFFDLTLIWRTSQLQYQAKAEASVRSRSQYGASSDPARKLATFFEQFFGKKVP